MKKMLALVFAGALLICMVSAPLWSGIRAAEQGTLVTGDITGDSKVNIADVSALYAHIRGTIRLNLENLTLRGDLNGDGRMNIADVAALYVRVKEASRFSDLQVYADKIRQAQSPTTLTLAVMSDTHYCGHGNSQSVKLETANKMAMLSRYVRVDAVANLGDFVAGNEPKDKTLEDLECLMAATEKNANCPVLFVRGNHDDNGWYSREEDGYPGSGTPEEIIDHAQWYERAFGDHARAVVTDSANPNGGYGYFDHEASKIRVFLLNTSDIPYVQEENGTYRYNAYECNAFGNAQLNFVARSLLFEDKQVPNDWAAMFLMHVPIDTTVADGYRFGAANTPIRGYVQMLSIIDAYRKGISYSYTGSINAVRDKVTGEPIERPEHFRVTVRADYSQKGCGDVIAFVNGHTHIDNASREVGYDYSLSYGYTYLSVVGSDGFSTLVVDREKSAVSIFKYGKVRGPAQSTDPQIIKNGKVLLANGEKEFGIDFSKDTQWVVPFRQFRPQGESLLLGTDPVALDGMTLPDSYTGLSLENETMLPNVLLEDERYAISVPIRLKQNTQYEIPNIGQSKVYTFHHSLLTCRGIYQPMYHNDQWIITGGQNNGFFALFVFDKESYPDYEDFYIKERVHQDVPPNGALPPQSGEASRPEETPVKPPAGVEGNLFNGMSELWAQGYIVDTTAKLNVETMELPTAKENPKYAITKAIAVKSGTEYQVSDCGSAVVYAYSADGIYNGSVILHDADGYKTFSCTGNRAYVVFCFHKYSYPDYENFYMKER